MSAAVMVGWRLTLTFRLWDRTLTVPSSFADRYTPYVDGGAQSLSISSFSETMCSRASCSACTSFSFSLAARTSCRLASSRSSSTILREFLGDSLRGLPFSNSSTSESNATDFGLMTEHLRALDLQRPIRPVPCVSRVLCETPAQPAVQAVCPARSEAGFRVDSVGI